MPVCVRDHVIPTRIACTRCCHPANDVIITKRGCSSPYVRNCHSERSRVIVASPTYHDHCGTASKVVVVEDDFHHRHHHHHHQQPVLCTETKYNIVQGDSHHPLLESWFMRFDKDSDGLLSIMELKLLLEHLGARLKMINVRRIMELADLDHDHRLSFAEFLQMWHLAVAHEAEFWENTEQHELVHIARMYKLFPYACSFRCSASCNIPRLERCRRTHFENNRTNRVSQVYQAEETNDNNWYRTEMTIRLNDEGGIEGYEEETYTRDVRDMAPRDEKEVCECGAGEYVTLFQLPDNRIENPLAILNDEDQIEGTQFIETILPIFSCNRRYISAPM